MSDSKHVIQGTLAEWVPVLREMLPDYGEFAATLLVGCESPDERVAEHPITAVEVDEHGAEINLCADPDAAAALTVSALMVRLEALPTRYSGYHLYSAAPRRELADGVEIRADAPIVNVVVDAIGRRVGFVGEGVRLDS